MRRIWGLIFIFLFLVAINIGSSETFAEVDIDYESDFSDSFGVSDTSDYIIPRLSLDDATVSVNCIIPYTEGDRILFKNIAIQMFCNVSIVSDLISDCDCAQCVFSSAKGSVGQDGDADLTFSKDDLISVPPGAGEAEGDDKSSSNFVWGKTCIPPSEELREELLRRGAEPIKRALGVEL